jgi:putative nucleotidyltransferase with HDIG domain
MLDRQIQGDFLWFGQFLAEPLKRMRMPRAVEAYAFVLAGCTVALAAGLSLLDGAGDMPFVPVLALAGVAWFAEKQSVQLTSNAQMSVSVMPVLFAAVVYGPVAAMVVGAAALMAEFAKPYTRWLVWTATRALAAGLAGIAAAAVGADNSSLGTLVVAVAVAGSVEAVTDIGLGALTLVVRRSGSVLRTAKAMSRLVVGLIPLYTPVLAILAYAYQHVSPWTVVLFFAPAIAAQRLFVLYQEQRQLTDDLVAVNERLERANLSFATALVATLDARDRYTAGHSAAVAIYSRDIASRLGLPPEQQRLAHVAGLVHDIGKVGLPAGLLEKAGPLSLQERRTMETHSAIGERILGKVEDYQRVASIVRHHHERVDGRGYPDGLGADEIPLISRIIAVADAYNAMTSDRPYRDAMPSRVARLRLAQAVESQFDTAVVAAFEAILATADESYRLATAPEFTLQAQDRYSSASAATEAA